MKERIDDEHNSRELYDFQQWVESLTLSQLQSAMEFIPDEVLKDIVKPPPPTPIHPRIYAGRTKWATCVGANDGRASVGEKLQLSKPRLFQVIKETSTACKGRKTAGSRRPPPPKMSWNVIARRFIAPDGEVLGLGCTQEQISADGKIVLGTSIKIASDGDGCKCFFGSPPSETNTSLVDSSFTTRDLLRMLRVASRGYLLESVVPTSDSTLWPPWLNPTRRWFSLAMYIASRYEVALWSCFRSKVSSSNKTPFLNMGETKLSFSVMREIRQKALVRALKRVILPECREGLPMVRDTALYHLLEELDKGNSYSLVESCPILRFQTLMYDKCYSTMQRIVQEGIVQKRQELLLSSLDNEPKRDSETKKKVKRKKKKKQRKKQQPKEKYSSMSTTPSDQESSEVQSDVEDHHVRFSLQNTSRAKVPSMEETRKTLMVMTILDDVLSTAFERVGLSKGEKEGTCKECKEEKVRKNFPLEESDAAETKTMVVDSSDSTKNVISEQEVEGKKVLRSSPTHNASRVQSPPLVTRGNRHHRDSDNCPPVESDDDGIDRMRNNYYENFFQNPFLSTQHSFPVTASTPRPIGLADGISTLPFPSQGDFNTQSNHLFFHCNSPYQDYEQDSNLQIIEGHNTHKMHRSSSFETDISLLTSLYLEDGADSSPSTNLMVDHSHCGNNREKSVFEGVFISSRVASSTGASIASSSANDESDLMCNDANEDVLDKSCSSIESCQEETQASPSTSLKITSESEKIRNVTNATPTDEHSLRTLTKKEDVYSTLQSRSSERPPSPQLSPILVSQSDLQENREGCSEDDRETKSCSGFAGSSLPGSPVQGVNHLNSSWSRDDFRIDSSNGDQRLDKKNIITSAQRPSGGTVSAPMRPDVLASYRNVALRPLSKKTNVKIERLKARNQLDARHTFSFGAEHLDPGALNLADNNCARSETAVEALSVHDEGWYRHHRQKNISSRLDGAMQHDITGSTGETKFSSTCSPRHDPEEMVTLREERNTFRDMCLTLGAEVAKLKNLLAAQSGSSHGVPQQEYFYDVSAPISHNPEFTMMQPSFHGRATMTIGALSDGGFHRGGDHESTIVSEDGTGTDYATTSHEVTKQTQASRSTRRHSSGLTGSDVSLERNFGFSQQQCNIARCSDVLGNDIASGLHSRLTKDIVKFLHANDVQLQKEDRRRSKAVDYLSRLVTAVWPRAQVHLYGSHVTGLAIPSSDLDFVICLPAVHKNAPAITPGALEGRNAINESSQKLLARRLKAEAWIDPRSIKIIERTVVPVIKVSTKDTRANMLHLDISFDGPIHHGLEAIDLVNETLQELSMTRPLVLLLKQFLLDRGLLTAYTGGLSSYCLFLMVTRYLQEQPSSWGDCGSLLMGFLDFYGNYFDPRVTGISVQRRQYFARRAPPIPPPPPPPPPPRAATVYPPSIPSHTASPARRPVFIRNLSSEKIISSNFECNRHSQQFTPPVHPAFPPPTTFVESDNNAMGGLSSGRSYTFDPLWVEDPLSSGNNVGRNAFRIFQVQRAFSDAHRALVASLEWESDEQVVDYPLLKCLLQSEDVLYDLDDYHR